MATLESRLSSLISAIGPDMKKALPRYISFGRSGTLAVFTGPRVYFPDTVTLESATFALTTAPIGAGSISFEIFKNGASIWSAVPQLTNPNFLATAGTLAGVTTYTARTDYLQIACVGLGSTTVGADLAVVLKLVPA